MRRCGRAVQRRGRGLEQSLRPEDWLEALDGHPRIGERGGASAESSRMEQAGVSRAHTDVPVALAAGNRECEDRFGHIFLISAADRGAGGMPGEPAVEAQQRPGHPRSRSPPSSIDGSPGSG